MQSRLLLNIVQQWINTCVQQIAAEETATPPMLRLLKEMIARGANIEIRNEDDETPLHIAAKSGNREALDILLRAGASMSALDCDGRTPIQVACLHYKFTVIESLIQHGAANNINYRDPQGRTVQF